MITSVWFLCDREISIGAYTMISWSVVIMDGYRVPRDARLRREVLRRLPDAPGRKLDAAFEHATEEARPVRIGDDVYVGHNATILKGVTIGDGAIVGARSVVDTDVEAYTVVAGNPARFVRRLARPTAEALR